MSKPLCIYHADCADGLLAAWAVRRALGDEVEFVAVKYGDQIYWPAECSRTCEDKDCLYIHSERWAFDIKNRDILIVDFSYPLSVLRAMAQEARSVLVLDHHKTAQEDLAGLESFYGPYSDLLYHTSGGEPGKDNLYALFDLSRSGAGITWDYLHPGKSRPRIIDLVEDRDLWKFKFGDETRAFHAVLASYDWSDREEMFKRLNDWSNIARLHDQIADDPSIGRELGRETSWEVLLKEGFANGEITLLRSNNIALAGFLREAETKLAEAWKEIERLNQECQFLAKQNSELRSQVMAPLEQQQTALAVATSVVDEWWRQSSIRDEDVASLISIAILDARRVGAARMREQAARYIENCDTGAGALIAPAVRLLPLLGDAGELTRLRAPASKDAMEIAWTHMNYTRPLPDTPEFEKEWTGARALADTINHAIESARAEVEARFRPLVEAARKRLERKHNDTCGAVLTDNPPHYPCDCGYDTLADALAALEEGDQRK